MGTNVITITRQFGSMGRPIAKAVAEKLGFAYYDRDIIDAAASSVSMPVEKYLEMSDKPLSKYDKMMYPLGIGDAVKQDMIFEAEKKAILKLAEKQNCVIVGRCSDYILSTAKKKELLSIFIYAPVETRERFCQKELGILPEKVDDYIIRVDSGREEYYKRHTGEDFKSPRYRNMMLDSAVLPMEEAVELICQMAKFRFKL